MRNPSVVVKVEETPNTGGLFQVVVERQGVSLLERRVVALNTIKVATNLRRPVAERMARKLNLAMEQER